MDQLPPEIICAIVEKWPDIALPMAFTCKRLHAIIKGAYLAWARQLIIGNLGAEAQFSLVSLIKYYSFARLFRQIEYINIVSCYFYIEYDRPVTSVTIINSSGDETIYELYIHDYDCYIHANKWFDQNGLIDIEALKHIFQHISEANHINIHDKDRADIATPEKAKRFDMVKDFDFEFWRGFPRIQAITLYSGRYPWCYPENRSIIFNCIDYNNYYGIRVIRNVVREDLPGIHHEVEYFGGKRRIIMSGPKGIKKRARR